MATNIINLSSLDGSNGFRMDGAADFDFSGKVVSNAGDVNGDGYADMIVSSYGGGGDSGGGSTSVIFGSTLGFNAAIDLSTLNGDNGFHLNSSDYGLSGSALSNAGDVNGDGFGDVIVGAPHAFPNGSLSGSSYVIFGKPAGFAATVDVSNLDGNNGFRLDGKAFDLSGNSVSNAGDINGDGFDDLIVSAIFASKNGEFPNGDLSGSSYVIFGKAVGFDAVQNLSILDGRNGFRIDGVAGDVLGASISNAGDVNGDGYGDVVVGAVQADPNGPGSGSSYVVFGKASGFDSVLDVSHLDGTNGFRLNGIASNDAAGASVSNAGDINGDGIGDLLIGAPFAGINSDVSGSSYVIFGKATDFNDTIDLYDLDGSNGFRLNGEALNSNSGFSVSNAGDVNGDGFEDLIIGAPGNSSSAYASGSSYVVFGKASGFAASIDLSNLDNDSGFRLDGVSGSNFSGSSVSSAGDVNGDGFDDVLIGSPNASSNHAYSGSSYVVFGRDFNGKVTDMGTAKADKLKGGKGIDCMVAGDGDDTLIGRGGKDVFHAGAGDDIIEIRDTKFQLADGGAGLDTLKLDDSHLNLNLTKERGHISDIEAIDLKGNGSNKLTLTALDVLNLSSTSNTLIVDGNRNDRVVARDSGWEDDGISHGYHTFTNGEATLLIGVHVAMDLG